MKAYPTSEIRNVVLLGHGDAGKTSLCSAMLFACGAVNRFGKVDDGSSTTDFDEEEIERKISLQTAIAHAEWTGKKINLIDTPGYAAFVADAKVALPVSDLALVVVEAVSGVQVITERTFGYAEQYETPVGFVLNKMDRGHEARTCAKLTRAYPRAIAVSALKREGLDELRALVASVLPPPTARVQAKSWRQY